MDERKKYRLAPVMLFFVMVGALLVLADFGDRAFVYTLF